MSGKTVKQTNKKVTEVTEELKGLMEQVKQSKGTRKQEVTIGNVTFESKKEAILFFSAQGLTIAHIARLMDIRYQHVRNVVKGS